jgi:hypothetical protein
MIQKIKQIPLTVIASAILLVFLVLVLAVISPHSLFAMSFIALVCGAVLRIVYFIGEGK